METKEISTGIEEGMTLNEVVRLFPAAVEVFHRHGMDACCGGALPVREAAERHGVDPEALAREVAALLALPPGEERGITAPPPG